MTYWERLNKENPRAAEWETADGTEIGRDCPCDYGYEAEQYCQQFDTMPCARCWHREMPEVKA